MHPVIKLALLGIVGFSVVVTGVATYSKVMAEYTFTNQYSNYWNLADKSSTLKAKKDYIDKYVQALETGYKEKRFANHDAVWLKTPDNEFASNLAALKTLADRLGEIQNMDPSSFQYNTAIEQITKQEQGEARAMSEVLYGCYAL